MQYTIEEAEADLDRLITSALKGHDVIIARGGAPVVKLTPLAPARPRPVFGSMKGRIALTDAFFEPLPDDELALWNGEGS
jgi:antitoxin (DNA-binding transcriptional repressor) of toxin-antitoxin stability system